MPLPTFFHSLVSFHPNFISFHHRFFLTCTSHSSFFNWQLPLLEYTPNTVRVLGSFDDFANTFAKINTSRIHRASFIPCKCLLSIEKVKTKRFIYPIFQFTTFYLHTSYIFILSYTYSTKRHSHNIFIPPFKPTIKHITSCFQNFN